MSSMRSLLRGLPTVKPGFVDPMKALLVGTLPHGSRWLYEVKFDGFRALAIKDGRRVSLLSRNARSLLDRYPTLAAEFSQLQVKQAVFDGEIVAVDEDGRSSFQRLQSFQTPTRIKPPLFYYAFDLLNLNGRSLTGLPLVQRKELLQQLLAGAPDGIRYSGSIHAEAKAMLQEMQKHGLEGVIAKRADSLYEIGRRSGAWVKFKWSHEQEFVIGGYTPPKGTREGFGAILVGYYANGRLLFASKVGAGFDQKMLESLHRAFRKHIVSQCPFANLPERTPIGLSAAEMRACTWLRPEMVCQVRFTEWTRDHHLRHPVFLGLRDDKSAEEVAREEPS